jgi:hypothetical protein
MVYTRVVEAAAMLNPHNSPARSLARSGLDNRLRAAGRGF